MQGSVCSVQVKGGIENDYECSVNTVQGSVQGFECYVQGSGLNGA